MERGSSRVGNGWLRLAAAGLLVAGLSACATYGDWVQRMEREIAAGDYEAALAVLEANGRKDRDAVLYLLNRGLLLRMAGEFAASNAAFEEAKILMAHLAAVSVSEQAGALTINELVQSYTGELHEQVLVHLFAALNHLDLGQPLEARVEILQLDELLQQLEDEPIAGGAFARYFSGLLFESLGERDDALIAYRKAYQAYLAYPEDAALPPPRSLQFDLLRLTEALGLADETRRLRRELALENARVSPPPASEVVLILFSGLAPVKQETHLSVVTEAGELVTIAMPYYEDRPPHVQGMIVTADGEHTVAETVEDVNVLAVAALERRKPLILARALARAALKHEMVEKAGEKNDGLGLLVNIATVATERADTRSWSILPSRIYLARLALSSGERRLHVQLLDAAGKVVARRTLRARLEPGRRLFLSLHWIDEEDLAWHPD